MDEEEEKKQKLLEAGKAALLAFQKGKKKRKKKKKAAAATDSASEDITEELSTAFSENVSSLDQVSLHSGNVSPIPFDQTSTQEPVVSNDQQHPIPCMVEEDEAISDVKTVDQPPVSHSPSTDGYLQLHEPTLEQEKPVDSLMDIPGLDSYDQGIYTSNTAELFDTDHTDHAETQLHSDVNLVTDEWGNASLSDGLQEKLSNDLATGQVASAALGHHQQEQQQEVEKLKEKLEVTSSSLKEVEQELLAYRHRYEEQIKSLNTTHAAELEKVHEQHRVVVEKLASDAPTQHSQTDMSHLDRDELEMERLKVIKDSLKENFEKEKTELKESLTKEHQQKMESFKQQMEENANAQLQAYHNQYLTAFEGQRKQKEEAEAALLQTLDTKELEFRIKLSKLEKQCNSLEEMLSQANHKKQLADERVAELNKSLSDQFESMQLGKQKYENHVTTLEENIAQWKTKAAEIEQRLLDSTPKPDTTVPAESLQLKDDYEERLATAAHEKSQVETQLLSQMNALKEELSREKQQQQLSVEVKDIEIATLTKDLEKLRKEYESQPAEPDVTVDMSKEIEELQNKHHEALEELKRSLAQAHEELNASHSKIDSLNSQLQALSDQMTELSESKQDALSQLEMSQHQLNNCQSSLSKANEEREQLIADVPKYQSQIHSLEVDLSVAKSSNAQSLEKSLKDIESYQEQIKQLESTVNKFQFNETSLQAQLKDLQEQKLLEERVNPSDALFAELDGDVLRKAEQLASSKFTSAIELITKLLGTLESKASEVSMLENLKENLVSQISDLQANISEDKPDSAELDVLHKYEQLQVAYDKLQDSSSKLSQQVENLNRERQVLLNTHEQQLREKESEIVSLRNQLQTAKIVSSDLQDEFGRECAKYESEKQSLEEAMKKESVAKDALDNIVSTKTKELEQAFKSERKALVEKITEKETLEAELTSRKIDLEKRLAEKSKLEEVLFEKSRLEQELRVQKAELERELFEIEAKVKSRESEIQQERSEWSLEITKKESDIKLAEDKLQQKDEDYLQKEQGLKEAHQQELQTLKSDVEHSSNLRAKEIIDNLTSSHSEEIVTLKNDMEVKSSTALNKLESKLSRSHQDELGELKRKHSVEIMSITSEHKKTVEDLTAKLYEKQQEIANLTTALNAKHEAAMADLTNQLESKRQKELSTLKEVLERQRNEALAELRQQLIIEKQQELEACKVECKYHYDMKLEEQRKLLEERHSLYLEEHEKGISTDQKQQMESELQHQQQMHDAKIRQLELESAETLKNTLEEVKKDLLAKHQAEMAALQEKFNTDIAEALHIQKTSLHQQHTEDIDKVNADFDIRLATSIDAAKSELSSQFQKDIAAKESSHHSEIATHEETIHNYEKNKSDLEMLQLQHKNEIDALKSQITETEKVSLDTVSTNAYCEELKMKLSAKDEVIKELSDTANKTRLHHEQVENDLNARLSSLQEEYKTTCSQMKQDHAAALQTLQEKLVSQTTAKYEAKISTIQIEAEAVKQHLADIHQQKLDEVIKQHKEEMLTKEIQLEDQLATLQTDHKTKLNEVELQHISELESITSDFERELKKRDLEHQELKTNFTTVSAMNKSYTDKIQALEEELQKFSSGKSQDLQKLEHEIEALAKQNDTEIKSAEAKIANRYEEQFQNKLKELENNYITKIASLQTDKAIAFAQEMEQVKADISAEKERKLADAIAAAEKDHKLSLESAKLKYESLIAELNDKWQSKLQELEETLKHKHAQDMVELENRMAEERKQQLLTLKEKFEEAREVREAGFKVELEKQQVEHVKYIEELSMKFEQERKAALDGCKDQYSSAHIKEIESLNTELQAQKDSASILQTQLEEAHKNYATQLESVHSDHQTQIDQLNTHYQQQLEAAKAARHAELVQQHMAKFKNMTDQIVQKHQADMDEQSRSLKQTHIAEVEKLHKHYKQETGLLQNLLETKESQLKQTQTYVQQHVCSELLDEPMVMIKSLKQLVQSSTHSQPLLQTILTLETKLANMAQLLSRTSQSVVTLNFATVQLETADDDHSFSVQSLLDSQIEHYKTVEIELQRELVTQKQIVQDTEAEVATKSKEITEIEQTLEKEKEVSAKQASEITQLEEKLRNAMTVLQEQNVKLQQLTTKEHDDTTNTFALMRKDIEKLRTEKLAAEGQLATLESFIQECLHVVTMMSGSVAQQLLCYLQDETSTSQQQPVHPQRHSPASTVDSPSTPSDDKAAVLMQDSGLSSHQTTATTLVSEGADTPMADLTGLHGTSAMDPSLTIYAMQQSLTDSTVSQNTVCEPGELSIQNYEGMSGFPDVDSEEPIGTGHLPVQLVVSEVKKLLGSRGTSTPQLILPHLPGTSGYAASASAFTDSLSNVQEIFLLLLQSFAFSNQEVVKCKKELADSQTELLQTNTELNQLLAEHESQCSQHEVTVQKLKNDNLDCESRLQSVNDKIGTLQKQVKDSNELVIELEALIAQSKEQSTEPGLKKEVERLSTLLEQKEAELMASINRQEELEHEGNNDMTPLDGEDQEEDTDSVTSTVTTSDDERLSSVDELDQEEYTDGDTNSTLNIISQLKAELTKNDDQIQQLKEELEQQSEIIASVKETNAKLSLHNSTVAESNATLLASVQQLQNIVSERDETIKLLNDNLSQLQSQHEAQQKTLSTKCSAILDENKSLSAELAVQNEEAEKMKVALQKSGEEMKALRSELNNVIESNTSLMKLLESDKNTAATQLAEKVAELKLTQQQLAQKQEELLLKERQVQKIESQMTSQLKESKVNEEVLEQMKVASQGMQDHISKLEGDLARVKEETVKCNSTKSQLEKQYKTAVDAHTEELAVLKLQHDQDMVKLQESFDHKLSEVNRQHETAQAELKLSNTQELARVTSEHNTTVRGLEASHTRQVTALKLDHSEELLKQKEDLEAQHAGQMSYMKLHAKESAQESDSLEDNEDSEDDDATSPTTTTRANSISLLLKIAELAPVLRDEVEEVRDLCKLTGQSLPADQVDYHEEKSVLLEAIKSLSDLITQTAEATKPGTMEDWRRSLLDSVKQVLQKERDVLAAAVQSPGSDLPPDYQQLLQNQFANHAALLKELHSSDRDSLFAEIQQLRALVESMRNEQRQQLHNLFEQVKKLQQVAESEKNALKLEVHSSKGKHSAELDKLRKELDAEQERAEQFVQALENEQQHSQELGSSLTALKSDNKVLRDKLQKATDLDIQLQQALTESEKHKTDLMEQVGTLKHDVDRLSSKLVSERNALASLKQELSKKNDKVGKLEHHHTAAKSHQQAENIKLQSQLNQANERIKQLDQALTQHLEESAQLQQELSAKTSALQEHDKHFKKLKKSLAQQSETIEKLQSKTAAKATQYQAVLADMQLLLKEKEEAISQLNGIVQIKEAELTKNTDILLQEKVKSSELQEELNIYKQQLEELRAKELHSISQTKSLTDQCTESALELDHAKKKMASLEKEKTELCVQVAALKKRLSEVSTRKQKSEANPELARVYKQLQSMLASELSKNSALRDALAAGDADTSDLIKMIEMLLHREEIHAVTQESLQVDKDQLEREVRQLNKQISHLQTLLRSKQFSPGLVSSQTSLTTEDGGSSHTQGDAEVLHTEALLKQSLEEERLQVVLLKNQISMLEQKMAAAHSDHTVSPSPIMVDVCMQTVETKPADIKAHDSELIEIFLKYRESAERCKCLMYQKDYLVKQMNTFYQTEQAALIMIKEMGISVDWSPRPTIHHSSTRRSMRFRVVAFVVLATIRLPLLCKRRQQRRAAVMSKRKKVIQYVVGRSQQQRHLPRHKESASKIPVQKLPDYKPPIAARRPLHVLESPSQSTFLSTENTSEPHTLPAHDFESALRSDVVSFTPIKMNTQVQRQQKTMSAKTGKSFPEDPQVTAYLQGLERLQARLKKI